MQPQVLLRYWHEGRVFLSREKRQPSLRSLISMPPLGLFGFMRYADGCSLRHVESSRSSCRRLVTAGAPNIVIPVALPPGRLRLATKPFLTGSPLAVNTIGMVWVAAFATSGDGLPPVAANTATCRLYQISRQLGQSIVLAMRPAVFDRHVLTLRQSRFP